ncbi:MAG TPA: single-stranded-DNA-specific exonuclease RecJ, partial [Candidatus Acidoferrum sp.]|nr:single-stranded-DNA-specific exonuclease RecJ [Candidatus Acidoferrum sp.]
MKYRWSLPQEPSHGAAATLAGALGVGPLLAQCLVNRGLAGPEQAARFLRPRLKDLADPLLLPNMAAAVQRLRRARERREALVIFGDYDVDGVTATALLLETLRALGWNVNYYLPHRMDEGYGLSREAAENCRQKHPTSLLLAVDCGSTAADSIAWLGEKGTDVIVLDHHQVSEPPPRAVALVNPRLAGADARMAEFCSAGLAFKLAHALVRELRQAGEPAAVKYDLRRHLDLVALGTIADLVPLTGENRLLARAGLERLTATERPGLQALKAVAQCPSTIGSYEVGFQLAPRLNAAGRLEDAEEALCLLLAGGAAEADPLARRLDARNRQRQQIERAMAEEVIPAVAARFNREKDFVIVEGRDSWHIGVVGIVAARVVKRFYRPAIILGGDGPVWRGSGRSIEGFDLAAALRNCDALLLAHGGHGMAAGVTAQPGLVDRFRERMNELARQALTPEQLEPCLRLDGEVAGPDLTLELVEQLAALAPTGQGNPPVQWVMRGLRLRQPPQRMGRENQHVKWRVTDGRADLEAVWWNGGQAATPEGRFDLAFTPAINDYQGWR